MEIFQDCKDKLDIMQAGGAAEEHFFNSYSTAAANDFKKATDFAILMVQVFGFSKKMKTFVSFPEASEHIKLMQNEEAMELVHESWYRTKDSVKLYEKKIAKVAHKLLELKELDSKQLQSVLDETDGIDADNGHDKAGKRTRYKLIIKFVIKLRNLEI
ncbi:hypothetical protein ACQ4LE_001026 [Meloidogyne hapla]